MHKLVCIIEELVHRISQLPYGVRDPWEIVDSSGDVMMIETQKKKYKLEKGQQRYVIDSILDKVVHVAT